MGRKQKISRRRFLAGAAAGLAGPYVLTSGALGGPNKTPASDRVVAGVIGVGGRGTGLLGMHHDPRCTVAAVCDVYEPHLARAKKRIGTCDAYKDFRRIIDRSDIDAVVIATPDHWHAPMTIMACQSGKDVYCEKPLSRTILEGMAMVKAARRYGRVVQMGTQYRSRAAVRQVCEWVRNGRLGEVKQVRLWHRCNPRRKLVANCDPPATLDWDMWLGPCLRVPYNPARCPFSFRFFMEYAGGAVTDNGSHMYSIISWAMGTDHTGPVTIEGTGRPDPESAYDVPVEMNLRYEFADPAFVMTWDQPGDGAKGGPAIGMQFVGTEATLTELFGRHTVQRGSPDLSPTRPGEIHLHRSKDHAANWLECIATRARPAMDVEIGYRTTSWGHLGNIAYVTGRKLRWAPAKECFGRDDEANRLLHKPYRAPWRL